MRRLQVGFIALLTLAACDKATRLEIGGRQVVYGETELKQDLKGRRVVDMTGVQGLPVFESWSPEIEERMTLGSEQVASKLCGGPVELVSLSRFAFAARSASLRYRCL